MPGAMSDVHPAPALLLLQERLRIDAGLLGDGAQRPLGHVAGVVWNRRVAVERGVEPDLVRARGLAVKLQPQFLQRFTISR